MRLPFTSLLSIAIALAAPPSAHAELPPLIPRAVLFGEPRYGGLTVSPDGTRLMWHERDNDGRVHMRMRPVGGGAATRVPIPDDAGIQEIAWAYDGRHLLLMGDVGGNENFHLHALDLTSGAIRNLTPHPERRMRQIMLDPAHPDEVLVTLNQSSEPYQFAGGFFMMIPALIFIFYIRRYLFNMWGQISK